uniref:NADPH:adrenodoxin oxidoreductase, mitochondrial n=2 Tax=Mesocestoides corti TaxID=53468 RepID=A0A5K3ETK2_MESCO
MHFCCMQHHSGLHIDMLEKLPAPFGLVRYGVAPDHPEVKNVIDTFTQVAKNPRFNYFGNVTVGQDIKLRDLRRCYDAILLAYGASVDRRMNIEGEDLPGVIPAKNLVAWYNGYPSLDMPPPDLDCETVAIVGVGNVAIDVARILLSPIERLRTTDIPEPVVAHLASSRVRRVVLIGRRGPLHSAFTLKVFRELTHLPASKHGSAEELAVHFSPADVFETTMATGSGLHQFIAGLPRPRRRLTEFLLATAKRNAPTDLTGSDLLHCEFRYLRSPVRVIPRADSHSASSLLSNVKALDLRINVLEGPPSDHQKCISDVSAPLERLECGLVVRSIGYRSVQIDPDLPFDEARGVVACKDEFGRVAGEADGALLYASGWAKRGAVGVIVDTLTDSRLTAQVILQDLDSRNSTTSDAMGFQSLREALQQAGVRPVTFEDWERIDTVEQSVGQSYGKPREKITSLEGLLKVAFRQAAESRNHRQ